MVGLAPLLAHHVRGGDHIGQDGLRRVGFDFDGVVVNLADLFDVAVGGLQVRALALHAGKAEHDVVGREWGAVMELHTLAQFETPHGGGGLLPGGGQCGGQAQILVAAHQGFVHVTGHAQLQRFVERVRVHGQRIALIGDPDGLGIGHQTRRGQRGKQSGQSNFFLEFHGNLL
ncbi:hypothetical protein D3C71_1400900 [compost metagenome]